MKQTTQFFTIIFGPTATGKSELAYQLAKQQQAGILSFDSRQIYQGMAIVTGQDRPDPKIYNGPIYGYDLVKPNADFSIRHYYEYAQEIINQHRDQQKRLILVGGSWPYARVLLDPPSTLLVKPNTKLRQQLENLAVINLQNKLQLLDPQKWQSLNHSDQLNPRRLIRAIEVATAQANQSTTTSPPLAQPLINPAEYQLIIKSLPLAEISNNIKTRLESRLAAGALDETKQLIKQYPHWNSPAFSATGYQHLRNYLEGKIDLKTAKKMWWQQERSYAKRQLTWVKSLGA